MALLRCTLTWGGGCTILALTTARRANVAGCRWITEALSHFEHKPRFFDGAFRMLKPGGKLVLADWMRDEHLTPEAIDTRIKPIESGMLRECRMRVVSTPAPRGGAVPVRVVSGCD